MNINDQQIVDHLYSQIFMQQFRYNYFNNITSKQHINSVWNKTSDEKEILKSMVESYKNFYKNKAEYIKTQLEIIKNHNITSYLTYNTQYYVNEYNSHVEDVDKYLSKLKSKTIDNIDDDLSHISENVDKLFPYMFNIPTLLGHLSPPKSKEI
jgi:tRNA G26 N,N-dimethylase Trm1